MPIIAKGKEFEQCPAGLHSAKVKAIESFTHDAWGDRVKFIFETDVVGKEEQNLSVFHEASLNLSPKAKLSGIIESILGRPITPDERKNGFDVESLLGMNCQISVKHRLAQTGNEYAFVDAIIPKGNHQQQPTPVSVEGHNEAGVEVEDDIPF